MNMGKSGEFFFVVLCCQRLLASPVAARPGSFFQQPRRHLQSQLGVDHPGPLQEHGPGLWRVGVNLVSTKKQKKKKEKRTDFV